MERSRLSEHLNQMMQFGVIVDPILANYYFVTNGHTETAKIALEMAHDMNIQWFRMEILSAEMEDVPLSPRLLLWCLQETVVSTALEIAHFEMKSVDLTLDMLHTAARRLKQLISNIGIASLYKLYFIIVGHDVLQPLYQRKNITEPEFLQGICHHPYRTEHLDTLLLVGTSHGSIRYRFTGRTPRVLQLTRSGVDRYLWARDLLESTGYLSRRMSLSYLYHFESIKDWSDISKSICPDLGTIRSMFVEWLGLTDGANVLEIASGSNSLGVETDLVKRMGKHGNLTVLDSSPDIVERAAGMGQIPVTDGTTVFRHVPGTSLPFANHVFDMCLGGMFLHLVNPSDTVREMARVVVPGGTIGVFQVLSFELLSLPFFRDWFSPILEFTRKQESSSEQPVLPTVSEVAGWLRDAGLQSIRTQCTSVSWVFDNADLTVQYLVRYAGIFQPVMANLSWDHQRAIVAELVDRGRDICRRYPLAERIVEVPLGFVKGVKAHS